MPGPKPTCIELTAKQQEVLEKFVRRQTSPQRLVRRCRIVLEAAAGANNSQIGRRLHIQRYTVRTWRDRWAAAAEGLQVAEGEGVDGKVLAELVEEVLADEPRPGAPCTFSAEQIAQIIAVACEEPPASGRPVTHWVPRELADEVIKRGIVESISPRSVGRFLKGGGGEAPSESVLEERQSRRSRSLRARGGDRVRYVQ